VALCGLHLPDEKQYLVEQRLAPLLPELGCESFAQLCRLLDGQPSVELRRSVIEAMTTNETSFFRDGTPFSAFREHVLPELCSRLATRRRSARAAGGPGPVIRIWSAAASTGQEVYSLAILLREFCHGHGSSNADEDFHFLGTDISSKALAKAAAGVYNNVDISRGLAPEIRDKYFLRQGKGWAVKEEIRRMVEFRKLNLTERFAFLGHFDLIFCRNVLIYFDDATRRTILDRLCEALVPDGILFLGGTETLYLLSEKFTSVTLGKCGAYRKRREP